MLLNASGIHRLAVYSFYDPDGIVDRYVTYFLADFCKNIDELVIVCNGRLCEEGRQALLAFTPNIIVRENYGFDMYGYQAGIRFFGWERLLGCDELVLCNDTIMGPVYPFSETFEKMAQRDLDFWGLTCYFQNNARFNGPYGYIPQHIQSFFWVMRPSLMKDPAFQAFWENLPPLNSYEEAVAQCETRFTKYFADMGYHWDVSVDASDLEPLINNPLFFLPRLLIEDKRCPVFKRRSFWQDYMTLAEVGPGNEALDLIRFLHKHTDYDTDMIWENLLRTRHQADLVDTLHLHYILGAGTDDTSVAIPATDICLIMHLCHADRFASFLRRAMYMPQGCDVCLLTDTQEKAAQLRTLFLSSHFNNVTVRIIADTASTPAALLIGAKDIVACHTLCCFVHDSRIDALKPGLLSYNLSEYNLRNILASAAFCQDVARQFAQNPRLGMLVPPTPYFAIWYMLTGNEWTPEVYSAARTFAAKLKLHVPMDMEKSPVAPFYNMFWFRSDALKPLIEHSWTYADFPEDHKIPVNSAIVRLYSFVAQHCGYYPCFVSDIGMAPSQAVSQTYYLSGFNRIFAKKGIPRTLLPKQVEDVVRYAWFLDCYRGMPFRTRLLLQIKRMLPRRIRKFVIRVKRRLLHQTLPYFDESL